ncbi:MAG: UDP-N-acetylmuramoyl-tripeptide--D-alanyl-D-alanine ligase [Chthoniobacterales bacterium]
MDPTSILTLADWCDGRIEAGSASPAELCIDSISKDTRSIKSGSLYLALRGEKFDGNDFLLQAREAGAIAAIVDRPDISSPDKSFPLIRVEDSLAALHSLASAWRKQLTLRVVGITGSSGKTSTKDLIAGVLGHRFATIKTEGNLNNHIGLPLSILRATSQDQMAVWEMGMNHIGEIAPLAALAQPDIGVIVNIGTAHIEFLGSQEAIALEKSALLKALPPDGVAVLNADDAFTSLLSKQTCASIFTAGIQGGELRADNIREEESGIQFTLCHGGESAQTHLQTHGRHMVSNALLAAAVGLKSGLSLEDCATALSKVTLTSGRQQLRKISDILFIDDTYNANPDSMQAALRTLADVPADGRRIAVLGRMGELGSYAPEGYKQTGKHAAQHADILITIGSDATAIADAAHADGLQKIFKVTDHTEAVALLRSIARPADTVLVKGSRAAGLERIFVALESKTPHQPVTT